MKLSLWIGIKRMAFVRDDLSDEDTVWLHSADIAASWIEPVRSDRSEFARYFKQIDVHHSFIDDVYSAFKTINSHILKVMSRYSDGRIARAEAMHETDELKSLRHVQMEKALLSIRKL